MKTYFLTTAAVIGFVGLAGPATADEESEIRELAKFDRVVIEGAVDINVEVGGKQRVQVNVSRSGYLPRVETHVSNSTLTIDTKGGNWRDVDVEVNISMESLREFRVDGAADANISGVDSGELAVVIGGAGDIDVNGSCGVLALDIGGAGDFSARDLKCKSAKVKIGGAGDTELTVSESIDVELKGAGDISVGGTCAKAVYVVAGAGDINARDLKCRDVTVELDGVGNAEVYASNLIEARINGFGDIEVYGNPKDVRPKISGFGEFRVAD